MKILILFSGIGGATLGIKSVFPNAEYTTVDIDEKCKPSILHDALSFDKEFYEQFDFIWASPECKGYSITGKANNTLCGKEYSKLAQQTYELLKTIGKPFCIENVIGCQIYNNGQLIKPSIILNGYNFKELTDIRRRNFWCNFIIKQPSIYPKIYPSKRLISGGGGFIRKNENVIRMPLNEAVTRFPVDLSHLTTEKEKMYYIAQIVIPEYAKYIMNEFKSNTIFNEKKDEAL